MTPPASEVERLMAAGEELATAGEHGPALARFEAAWARLPEPKEGQEW